MTDIIKSADYHCPKCGKKPAEYQMADKVKRWRCAHCGASGLIATDRTPAPPGPKVHRHWSALDASGTASS